MNCIHGDDDETRWRWRLDNRIQKFNQKERAGIRLAWYVVSPRPVKMSAMVRGVVQCTSVWWSSVARSRSWQLQTLQSIPANPWTSPLGLLCSPLTNPASAQAKRGRVKNQFKIGVPTSKSFGQSQSPRQPQTPREYPGYKIHPGVELATL